MRLLQNKLSSDSYRPDPVKVKIGANTDESNPQEEQVGILALSSQLEDPMVLSGVIAAAIFALFVLLRLVKFIVVILI